MDADPIPSSSPAPEEFLHFEPAKLQEGGAPDPKWFCLRIAPKQEHIAITHLRKIFAISNSNLPAYLNFNLNLCRDAGPAAARYPARIPSNSTLSIFSLPPNLS